MNEEKSSYSYNSDFLLKNGKPWFPVMGELHYSRYPKKFWPEALDAWKVELQGEDYLLITSGIIWEQEGRVLFSWIFTEQEEMASLVYWNGTFGFPCSNKNPGERLG